MREILFKGKRADDKKWIYGFLIMNKYTAKENDKLIYITKPNIIPIGDIGEADYDGDGNYYEYEVIPETVGQYTGLCDKNGKKIFEGDIVKHYCNNEDKNIFDIGTIYWCERVCQFRRASRVHGQYYDIGIECEYEVIGNIHDNPELLKGGEG